MDTAKSLLEQELQKAALWKELLRAIDLRALVLLRDLLGEALALGFSLNELSKAQAVLKEEERKEAARQGLAEAVAVGDALPLQNALQEAVDCGLSEAEMAAGKARKRLSRAERGGS